MNLFMKYLIILFTLLAYSFATYSADKLSITNASIDSETEFFLEINLENSSLISAMQFDVDLDMTKFKLVDGSELNTSRIDGHEFSVSEMTNSKLRVIIFSSENKKYLVFVFPTSIIKYI